MVNLNEVGELIHSLTESYTELETARLTVRAATSRIVSTRKRLALLLGDEAAGRLLEGFEHVEG